MPANIWLRTVGGMLCATLVFAQAPGADEQDKMIAAMRGYAQQYIANLPNFICDQITQEFEAGKKPEHWHKRDKFTATLIFNEGREERSLEMINDRPVRHRSNWGMPLTTEGEFGILLGRVLGSGSHAALSWNSWQISGGKRLAAFDYSVDREHSTLRLAVGDTRRSVIGYGGSVYAEPETGRIWRITCVSTNIPSELRTRSINTTIDYGEVAIGSLEYLLPSRASVTLATSSNYIRNDMEFKSYRKFETGSVITYKSDADSGKQPPYPEI